MTTPNRGVLVATCLLALAAGGRAGAAPVITAATADLEVWAIQHSSHSPCAGTSWRHTADEGPLFVGEGGIDFGFCLDGTWMLRSDTADLAFACTLAGVPEWYEWGRFVWLDANVTAELAVAAPTILYATRILDTGPVAMTGHHDVVLTAPDGTVTALFAADSTATDASHVLTPGPWRVAIDVHAELSDRNLMTYAGAVAVSWTTPVAVETRSWGTLKSTYR